MNTSTLVVPSIVVLIVLGAVLFRLLWGASQVAAGAGLGGLAYLPKSMQRWIRRWLFDEHHIPPNGSA